MALVAQINRNDGAGYVMAGINSNVYLLLWYGGNVYYQKTTGEWFIWVPNVWNAHPHDPRQIESASGFSFSDVRGVIFDSALNWYTLNASGQVVRNGVPDTTTSNATLLLYFNQVVYYQSAGAFRSWNGSAWVNTTDPRIQQSANGTTLNSATGAIYDVGLSKWTLGPAVAPLTGFAVYHNDVVNAATSQVILLLYYNNLIYQQNSFNNWWHWDGLAFVADPGDPRGTESIDGITLTSTSGTITDAALTPWALQQVGAELKVAHNSIVDTNTSAVTLLLYFSHTVYYQTGTQFWRWTGTAWAASTDPRSTESPQNTRLTTTAGTIKDALLGTWALATAPVGKSGLGILHNGVLDPDASQVILLLYYNHRVYQNNNLGGWWYWDGAVWIASSNPAPGLTINTIAGVIVNAAFTVSGTISGYTTAPTLQYRDNNGAWVALPAGASVTATTFSFTHPAIAATTGAFAVSVRDFANQTLVVTSNSFAVSAQGTTTAPAQAIAAGYTRMVLNTDFLNTNEVTDYDSGQAAFWFTGTTEGRLIGASDYSIANSILDINVGGSYASSLTTVRNNSSVKSSPESIVTTPNVNGIIYNRGYFEAKMRCNGTTGGGTGNWWPSFWGTCRHDLPGDQLELDFVEINPRPANGFWNWFAADGSGQGPFGQAFVAGGADGYPGYDYTPSYNASGLDLNGGWNIIGCLWVADRITFYWNSAARRDAGIPDTIVGTYPTTTFINGQTNTGVQGSYRLNGANNGNGILLILGGSSGQNVQFDYVRVWQ